MKSSTMLGDVSRRALGLLPQPIANALRGLRRWTLNQRPARQVFRDIYLKNAWEGTESVSGPGSSLEATALARETIGRIIAEHHVQTVLDIPCGDVHWIGSCLPPGVKYIGGDIVPDIVARNQAAHARLGEFKVIDIVNDDLPPADLLLVRDCFIHLPNAMVRKALANIRRAQIKLFLTTTFPGLASNQDIEIGGFRPINLELPEFGLARPLSVALDEDGVRKNGKSMALWRVSEMSAF